MSKIYTIIYGLLNMDKRTFIQNMVIRYGTKDNISKIDSIIRHAEICWQALNNSGYGDTKKGTERPAENHYDSLDPIQKKDFDQFWKAFRKTDGKQRAALSWRKISPDKDLVEKIIKGAKKEAQERSERGSTPIWAEGWLNQRRWEDFDLTDKKKIEDNSERLELLSQLTHAKNMINSGINIDYWNNQILTLESKLKK